jgi:ParB family transcriptional regulator, chromosome partitioning protein
MSPASRRPLTIDDPVGGPEPCHVAHPLPPAPVDGPYREIPVNDIHPNPHQPRKQFDQKALAALADSVQERGVLQPIIVKPAQPDGFELIAGERRWRAARLAGLDRIPALVARSLELAIIENVVREDLTPIEEARSIALLLDDLGVTATDLARRLGRSRTDLAHTVRLLGLPDQAIELVNTGVLTKGHGKALLTEPDHHRRRVLALRAAEAGWSVRALEAEIAGKQDARPAKQRPHPDREAAADRLQDVLSGAIGSNAQARPYRDGYQVLLDQAGLDQLIQFLARAADRP